VAGNHPDLARLEMSGVAATAAGPSLWAPCACRANSALNAATLCSAAADLRDQRRKGSDVHCSPHAQSPRGDPEIG
jgi:hypothetical protein